MNNARWTAAAIGYMCGFAYAAALIVYQLGGLITGQVNFGAGTAAALVVLALLLFLIFRPNRYDSDHRRSTASSLDRKDKARA